MIHYERDLKVFSLIAWCVLLSTQYLTLHVCFVVVVVVALVVVVVL